MKLEKNSDESIHDVSDTALWVAAYRAQETLRKDAVFKDPLASVLAGKRGQKIAEDMGNANIMSWVMTVRTSAIDRLILNAIHDGVDTIVNLGAGLDTRPYRMSLPENLRWIDVDFANIIEYKNKMLKNHIPKCNLQMVSLDLSQQKKRREFFAEINETSKRILIITEGVIPYLKKEEVAELAQDIFSFPHFQFWIQDFFDTKLYRHPKGWVKKMKSAPFQFETPNWFDFFQKQGFVPHEKIQALDEAKKIGRHFPFGFLWNFIFRRVPKFIENKFYDKYGYVTLRRAKVNQHI